MTSECCDVVDRFDQCVHLLTSLLINGRCYLCQPKPSVDDDHQGADHPTKADLY